MNQHRHICRDLWVELTLHQHWIQAMFWTNRGLINGHVSRVSRPKGPTRHAYAWQIGSFWQDTLDIWFSPHQYVKFGLILLPPLSPPMRYMIQSLAAPYVGDRQCNFLNKSRCRPHWTSTPESYQSVRPFSNINSIWTSIILNKSWCVGYS